MDLLAPLRLQEGDVVGLRAGAPVPAYPESLASGFKTPNSLKKILHLKLSRWQSLEVGENIIVVEAGVKRFLGGIEGS